VTVVPHTGSAMWISVVIPCCNAAAVIRHQLRALAAQHCVRPWEVIIVDNGSTDGTRAEAERWRRRFARLVIVEAPARRAAAHARNVGAAAARGENIAFCDADDEVSACWLPAVDAALRGGEAVACRTETGKLNRPEAVSGRGTLQRDGLQQYTYPPFLPFSGGGQLAIRRRVFEQLGGFDESLVACEDADFCWRLQLAGYRLGFARDAVIHVRLRDSRLEMCRQARSWGEWNAALYKKYRPHGMPALPRARGVRALAGVARRAPHLLHPGRRDAWLWQASWMTGRLIGSIKHRVWAL
jgi:glycosyltransferase involved in cell wall biosynthesis